MRRVLFAGGELCSWWLGWRRRRRSGFAIMEFNMIIAFREECLCLSVCYVVVGKREREKDIPNTTWSHVASSAWGVMLLLLLLLSTLGERHSVTSLGVT